MKVSVRQIYIKPGISFPFSHLMQRRLSSELSSLVEASAEFCSRYGSDYNIVVNVSADTGIMDNLIKGPTVFKKNRTVEYTVFLPFDVIAGAKEKGCRVALKFLVHGIRSVLERVGVDPGRFDEKMAFIIDHICSEPMMLSRPWSG